VNKDLKKRLSELKKPAPAKAAVDAISRKLRTSREPAGKIATDVVSATPKAALAGHEDGRKDAPSATERSETIGDIVAALANRAEFANRTADDLWPHLMDELDRRNLKPAEKSNRADIAQSSISYFPPKKPKGYSITLARFRTIVSEARKTSDKHG
jgi:hypothetical protein